MLLFSQLDDIIQILMLLIDPLLVNFIVINQVLPLCNNPLKHLRIEELSLEEHRILPDDLLALLQLFIPLLKHPFQNIVLLAFKLDFGPQTPGGLLPKSV